MPRFQSAFALALGAFLTACAPQEASEVDEVPLGKADSFDAANQPVVPGMQMELVLARLPSSGAPLHEPWTGWWWPFDHKTNDEKNGIAYAWLPGEASPAHKYDTAFDATGPKSVAKWELAHHAAGDSWYGHCDGWALASTAAAEPLFAVLERGVCFRPNDIKALLTESYECDMSGQDVTLLGVECAESGPAVDEQGRIISDACRDVNAGLFHLTIANVIGRARRGLFFDRQTSVEIWNYPVRSYASELGEPRAPSDTERIHVAKGTKQVVAVETVLTYMRAHAPSTTRDFVFDTVTYEYLLELDGEGRVIGGEWIDGSKANHPDALKVPGLDAGPKHTPFSCNNPNLDFALVLDLARRSSSGAADECSPL